MSGAGGPGPELGLRLRADPDGGGDEGQPEQDLVVATCEDIDPVEVTRALSDLAPDVAVTPLFSNHPIFWTRVESSKKLDRREVSRRLGSARVRYVTSARRGTQTLPPRLDFCVTRARRQARDWPARGPTELVEADTPWRWFLRAKGADVNRRFCGTGAGTRLAVIDNDGLELERIPLEAEVPVAVAAIPRSHSHAALMLGWAVGATAANGKRFSGIAPDASPRFYCIPKPGNDVWTLPLAIARAVEDGADVIVCATYVEGQTSPMLDDALELAVRVGRGGRGTVVVMPTGREMSSPHDSVHSSLSLGLGEPAADPRVFCIGPSARDGGWFLWLDRRGRLRPFANRGPSVRFLAPGDDMAYPFAEEERAWHAESSGASGVASGVFLLLLATNPLLTLPDVDCLLRETSVALDPSGRAFEHGLADRRDFEPLGSDDDGHNAKHGYGRLSATTACLAATDPVALSLVRMGEHHAARAFVEASRGAPLAPGTSRAVWQFAVCVIMRDSTAAHALASMLRAARVWARHPERLGVQPRGHLLRQLGLLLRVLSDADPSGTRKEALLGLEVALRARSSAEAEGALEEAILRQLVDAAEWGRAPNTQAHRSGVVPASEAERPADPGSLRAGSG